MLSVFATQGIDGSYNLTQAGYLLIIAVIIAAMLLICLIRKPDEKGTLGTRKLVFSAMAIALATAASMIRSSATGTAREPACSRDLPTDFYS